MFSSSINAQTDRQAERQADNTDKDIPATVDPVDDGLGRDTDLHTQLG